LKSFPFFLLIIFFLSSADSTEIATFKISFVIDNSLEFDKFIDKLDTLRTKMQNDLLEDENELILMPEKKGAYTSKGYTGVIYNLNCLYM